MTPLTAVPAAPSVPTLFEMRTRRFASCALAFLLLGSPAAAVAQTPDAFSSALIRFATAVGGSFGDEGSQVEAALESLSRAVAQWGQHLRSLEARAAEPHASASTLLPLRLELGRQHMARGRTADAIRELDAAAALDPTRADVQLWRATAYAAADRPLESSGAFRAAWEGDRSNPVAAYGLLRGSTEGTPEERRAALQTLTNAYQLALTQRQPSRPSPFPFFTSASHVDSDPPLTLPAPYAAGYARLVAGDYAGALDRFRAASRTDPLLSDPARGSAELTEGSAALRQGRPSVAHARFRAALERAPASSEARRLLGVASWANHELETSIRELSQAVDLRPDDERARIMLARVLVESGAPAKAEEVLRQTIEVIPESTYARLWLGSVYMSLNRGIDAADTLEAAAPRTISGRRGLHATVGQLRQGAVDFEGMIDALSRSVRLNPNDAAVRAALANGYREQDRYDQALTEFIAALLIDPLSPSAYMGLGQLHLNAGHFADAALALQRLVALQPSYAEARYALANALLRSGRTEEGTKELAEFERLQERAVELRRRTMALAVIKEEATLRSSEGAFERAAALWQQAVDQEPRAAANHAALAGALAGAGRLEAAAQHYEQAAALGGSAEVFRQLAAIYGRLGRRDESARATARYEQALLASSSGERR